MVRQRRARRVDEIADRSRLGAGSKSHISTGKPIEPPRDDAADTARRPEDERKAPFGHPVAKVRILFDALDVIVQRPDAGLVQVSKVIAALFQIAK